MDHRTSVIRVLLIKEWKVIRTVLAWRAEPPEVPGMGSEVFVNGSHARNERRSPQTGCNVPGVLPEGPAEDLASSRKAMMKTGARSAA